MSTLIEADTDQLDAWRPITTVRVALAGCGEVGSALLVAPESVTVRRTSLLPDPARFVRLGQQLDRSVRQIAECLLVNGALLSDLLSSRGRVRQAGATRVAHVDSRAIRWALEVRGTSSMLHRSAPGSGIVHTDDHATRAWSIDPIAAPIDECDAPRARAWS